MKTIIVTGASRGLGRVIAERLLHDGFRVIGISRNAPDPIKDSILSSDRFIFLKFDFRNVSQIPRFMSGVRLKYDSIFGLVNNAAVGSSQILAMQSNIEIEDQININLLAPILVTKSVARSMMVRKEGRIVNISSIVARTGYKGLSSYASTKAGLEGFSRSLARELGPLGITVNTIAPGFLDTDMTSAMGSHNLEKIASRSALKKVAKPGSVAEVAALLMSESGSDISGSTYVVDAGATA